MAWGKYVRIMHFIFVSYFTRPRVKAILAIRHLSKWRHFNYEQFFLKKNASEKKQLLHTFSVVDNAGRMDFYTIVNVGNIRVNIQFVAKGQVQGVVKWNKYLAKHCMAMHLTVWQICLFVQREPINQARFEKKFGWQI